MANELTEGVAPTLKAAITAVGRSSALEGFGVANRSGRHS
jgi:hypothetical protein